MYYCKSAGSKENSRKSHIIQIPIKFNFGAVFKFVFNKEKLVMTIQNVLLCNDDTFSSELSSGFVEATVSSDSNFILTNRIIEKPDWFLTLQYKILYWRVFR